MSMQETKIDLLKDLVIEENAKFLSLETMIDAETKYVRDLRINLKNAIATENLSSKEAYLIALSIAVNEKNKILIESFTKLAIEIGATKEEISETHACASLLAVNNVFYRFRHFVKKESYKTMPAKIKMTIMMNPILGKVLFEIISLAVSAVNGCESCVSSHEASLINLGVSEEKIFDAIRLAAVVKGLSSVIN